MHGRILSRVLKQYGIKSVRIFEPQKGYRNEIWPIVTGNGDLINVTFFKREPDSLQRIHHADSVSEYLAKHGLPTRLRYDKRILQLHGKRGITNVGIYTYLPGETIPWEAYTMKHIKLLGRTMSDMHALLSKDIAVDNLPSVYEEYLAVIERMRRYFGHDDIVGALKEKLGLEVITTFDIYEQLLHDCDSQLSKQPLHMDFVRGNILFEGDRLTGVLDFEKTAMGAPVVDVARTLAFLLVDCKYKTEEKVRKYFLYSGYIKRGATKTLGDTPTRERLVELFLLYDFYKFLRHNPYESLPDNEHFVRTRDILIRIGVIR